MSMIGKTQAVEFDGRVIEARHGESLAACLTAAGVKSFRTTAHGAGRGLYCGMGVCQDCLVEVDGKPNQRACMTKVDRPLKVRSEAHGRPLPPVEEARGHASAPAIRVEHPELLIVGAGPGGLSAAIAARRAVRHSVWAAPVVITPGSVQPGTGQPRS